MRNLDTYSIPGVVRLNQKPEKVSSTTVTDWVKWMVRNPITTSELWALGDTGRVYQSTDSGATWSYVSGNSVASFGQGLAIWRDYLFVAGTTALDIYGPLSSSPSWTTAWKTLDSDSLYHPILVGQDDILYIGAGRYISSLQELTTFNPGSGSTYSFTAHALDLPVNYRVKCLAELGKNLMIGTWQGLAVHETKIADIFPWDRSSPTFNLPVRINENGVNAMLNVGNLLYILAGIEGKIFVSNGVQTSEIAKIPPSIADLAGGKFIYGSPGAIMNHQGRVHFGISGGGSIPGMGVWSLRANGKDNVLQYENVISTGSDGTTNQLRVGALLAINRDVFLIGWNDNTTYGIDKISQTLKYTSYAGYFDSALYQVGTPTNKRSFTQLDIQLARPLTTGQGIKISYRTNLTSSFTLVATLDFATQAGVSSYQFPAQILEAEFVQLRCEMTTGASNTTPELRYITLR